MESRAFTRLYCVLRQPRRTLTQTFEQQAVGFSSSAAGRPISSRGFDRSPSNPLLRDSPVDRRRPYSSSKPLHAEQDPPDSSRRQQPAPASALSRLTQSISPNKPARSSLGESSDPFDILQPPSASIKPSNYVSNEFHLYVYSHKHNTHITLTEPQQEDPTKPGRRRQSILLSLSTGNLGFRKSARGTYDAGYQLGAYVMSRIQNDGLLARIHRLELVLRGFGQGREAMTKILLGMEGSIIRDRIVRVVDATRVKMGGQRAPKPRRLG